MVQAVSLRSIKAYTNAQRLTLEVNGVVFGSVTPVGHIAVWRDVPLAPGRNEIGVRTDAGLSDTVVVDGTP